MIHPHMECIQSMAVFACYIESLPYLNFVQYLWLTVPGTLYYCHTRIGLHIVHHKCPHDHDYNISNNWEYYNTMADPVMEFLSRGGGGRMGYNKNSLLKGVNNITENRICKLEETDFLDSKTFLTKGSFTLFGMSKS